MSTGASRVIPSSETAGLYIGDLCMSHGIKLAPATGCLLCGTSIEDAGGRRLYASQSRGVCLAPQPPRPETASRRVRSEPFAADPALRINVWGGPGRFDDALFERARALFEQGMAPWFCQACGDRTCKACGAPLLRPHGYDVIEDGALPRSSRCSVTISWSSSSSSSSPWAISSSLLRSMASARPDSM